MQGWGGGDEKTHLTPMWPGFHTSLGVVCGLSLLVLCSAPRGFSLGTPVSPSPQNPTVTSIDLP